MAVVAGQGAAQGLQAIEQLLLNRHFGWLRSVRGYLRPMNKFRYSQGAAMGSDPTSAARRSILHQYVETFVVPVAGKRWPRVCEIGASLETTLIWWQLFPV